jgi:hypothetical protein
MLISVKRSRSWDVTVVNLFRLYDIASKSSSCSASTGYLIQGLALPLKYRRIVISCLSYITVLVSYDFKSYMSLFYWLPLALKSMYLIGIFPLGVAFGGK